MAASHEHIQVFALRKFHRNIHGASNNGDLLIQRQPANHLGSSSSRGQRNRFPLVDQGGGRSSNPSFFIRKFLDLSLKRTVIPEGFVKQRGHGNRTAVRSSQPTLTFQSVQVFTDRYYCDVQLLTQL